ncbi:hypothetical protein BDV93DRAFT_500197 [Ceratobasidium sp. AG-I]|nr:hypothetical protein BDV93DRAFT_500197 [Ceratobasidium sp. AG-I]
MMSVVSPLPDPFETSPRASPVNIITIEGINHPSLFLPIPATDPLSALLSKYIPLEVRPQRDLVGRYEEQTLETLVMSNSWRALARMAKDQIIATPSSDTAMILDLWSLRLSSLARMRLFNQATAECSNLYAILGTVSPLSVLCHVVPYELDVLHARTMYWAGDGRGYLDELVRLVRMCKRMARKGGLGDGYVGGGSGDEKGDARTVWTERGMRTGMMIVTQMVEMQDFTGALSMLRPLASSTSAPPELTFALARIMMEAGDAGGMQSFSAQVVENPGADAGTQALARALEVSMLGRWSEAEEILRKALEEESDNAILTNNLAVVLLSCGKLEEAIDLLESMLKTSPTAFVAVEPFLYNLATLYELRSNASIERKRHMLREVAQWGGDGIKTGALKLTA